MTGGDCSNRAMSFDVVENVLDYNIKLLDISIKSLGKSLRSIWQDLGLGHSTIVI